MDLLSFIYIVGVVSVVFVLAIVYLGIKRKIADQKIYVAEQTAKRMLEDAEREVATKRKEAALETKAEALKLRAEFEKESKERKNELSNLEKRLLQKEDSLDEKNKAFEDREKKIKDHEEYVINAGEKLKTITKNLTIELEKASRLSQEDAKKILLQKLEKEIEAESAEIIKKQEEHIKKEADRKAKEILTTAIQRCAVDHVVETTTSVVELPSDDMKGRIIGREGRNIRAFETATGVDLVVDDTPEAVILSSFDPLRREAARMTLEKLIVDGRIHPARVEEMYAKSQQELKQRMWEIGEKAVEEVGIHNLPAVLIQLLGRLRYRTSYGQNVLQHSIEVGLLAGMMAEEIGVNAKLARRAGLLHDIGKAIDHDVTGTHPKLGMMLAQKAGESEEVQHCIIAHHEDVPLKTVEAVLVLVADAISASRAGARRDTLEAYIKRLQNLENVAKSFEGVEKVYAIQAGREVRVIVQPNKVTDDKAVILAHDIARKIEAELDYPGEVRVTLIRETRAQDIAK